ncbi:MAG: STAS domain-containing protein [Lachnospiraceae bacterium]|nr:STAS domain-containing protein [Lachnospiraceae bacterium]
MTVTTNLDGTKLTVALEGKLGTTSAPELENAVKNNISGVTELVLDMEKLEYMASAGLRVLLSAAKVMKKQGSMKIVKVAPAVMDVFTFTGMADMLDIEPLE